jgi:adenosylcobinamide-GDP ribazoletransferase
MKDSHIGAFGAISIVLLIIIKVAAITSLVEKSDSFYIIIVMIFSRFFLVFLSTIAPYARKEGGTAHNIVGESKKRHLFVAFLQILIMTIFLHWDEVAKISIIFISGLLISLYILYRGKKRINGITGDLLGATCELSEAIMLIAACI